jgi:hypothetical protein
MRPYFGRLSTHFPSAKLASSQLGCVPWSADHSDDDRKPEYELVQDTHESTARKRLREALRQTLERPAFELDTWATEASQKQREHDRRVND